nr:hypothetical protein CUMW_226760 [Ipomoea batatas]
MPFRETKEGGISPSKILACISRYPRLKQSPIVSGILPDNLFPEMSKAFSVFKLPTAGDKGPVNELLESLDESQIKESRMECTSEIAGMKFKGEVLSDSSDWQSLQGASLEEHLERSKSR